MASSLPHVEMKVFEFDQNSTMSSTATTTSGGSSSGMHAAVEIMVPKSLSLTEQNQISSSSLSSSSVEILKIPQDSSCTNETTVLPVHQEDGTYPELYATTFTASICDMDVIICAAIAVFVDVQYCDIARNCG